MATKPLSSPPSSPSSSPSSSSDAPSEFENLVTPRVGTGGELYGDAITTPDDALIDYPESQDGTVVSAVQVAQIIPTPDAPPNVPESQSSVVSPVPEPPA